MYDVTVWFWALSTYYIILITLQQALPMARIYCKLFYFQLHFENIQETCGDSNYMGLMGEKT